MLEKIKKQLVEGKTFLQFGLMKSLGHAFAMILPLVVAKHFSPELFGSYSLAKMLVFFFSTFLISSSQTPFIVLANQERAQSGKINKTFSVQCLFLLFSLCVFSLITLCFGNYILTFAKISRLDLLFVFMAFIGLSFKVFLSNLFMAMGQRIKNSLVELAFGFSCLVFVFVFSYLDILNIRSVFLIYPISAAIVIVIFLKMIDFKSLFPFCLEKKLIREMFDFTKWVLVGAAAVYFINWGDNLVLRYFVTMEDLGIYNFAYQIFKGVIILTHVVIRYFEPFVSANIDNKQSMKAYIYSKRPTLFVLNFVLIIVLYALIPHLIHLIYGSVYAGSVAVLRILLIGSVLSLYSAFYIPLFHALKQYKFTQTVAVIQVSVNLLLNVILVPRMGIQGAAVATTIAYLIRMIFYEVYFRKKVKNLFGV